MINLSRRRFLGQLSTGAAGVAALSVTGFPGIKTKSAGPEPESGGGRIATILIETPRERLFDRLVAEIQNGATRLEMMAGVLLAGVREINPRPVGFKLHAVMMVGSALDLALRTEADDRWLPIFWNADDFKRSQARDIRAGDWTMPPLPETETWDEGRARAELIDALKSWDDHKADRAVAALFPYLSLDQFFEILWPFAARCFDNIGHKIIYTAQAYRALGHLDWRQHGLPVARSLVNSLLANKPGEHINLFEHNRVLSKTIRTDWLAGKAEPERSQNLLRFLRTATPESAAERAVALLNQGVAPGVVWDGLRLFASEMLYVDPTLLPVHPVTATNAFSIASRATQHDETRRLILLQAASWLPLYRDFLRRRVQGDQPRLDELKPIEEAIPLNDAFQELAQDARTGQAAILGLLRQEEMGERVVAGIRQNLYLKAVEHHQFKYTAAAFQEYAATDPVWRSHLLVAGLAYLPHSGHPDTTVYRQIRTALQKLKP